MFTKKTLLLLLFTVIGFTNQNAQFGFDQNLVEVKGFISFEKIHAGSELKFAVRLDVAESWHINSNKPNDEFLIPTEVKIDQQNIAISKIVFPSAEELEFSFSDKPVSVYEGEVTIYGLLKIAESQAEGEFPIRLTVTYQACNDATCMPPTDVEVILPLEIVNKSEPLNEINQGMFSSVDLSYSVQESMSEDDNLQSQLEESGLLLSLILVFFGGLALNLTPCVYPLIPITIGYFGGQSEGSTGRLFILGILYVLGMALTYSVVGVVTSLSGAVFGTLLQNPIVIIAIALIFFALSLSMFGLYEFKLPDSLVAKAGGAKSGTAGAFLMGLTMGIVAAPCIGPILLGLVTYVAAKGEPYFGFIMFFVLALGLGFPYLLLALFSGKIKNLPRAGFWMEAIKHIFGFLLIGMALYFLGPLIPKEINYYVVPVFMIGSSIYLVFIDKLANDVKGFRIFKNIFSVLVIATAVYMIWPVEEKSPDWQYYSEESYQEALNANEKILIDFYADWCIPCKELDALTFSDQRVIDKSKEFVTFKVDMTKTMSDETEIIRNKFSIIGMPTLILVNSKGNEQKRLTGFISADEFLDVLSQIE
ncbi:MAG: protein-disulfide reductase DsbD [Bacteroidota bacterium]